MVIPESIRAELVEQRDGVPLVIPAFGRVLGQRIEPTFEHLADRHVNAVTPRGPGGSNGCKRCLRASEPTDDGQELRLPIVVENRDLEAHSPTRCTKTCDPWFALDDDPLI